MPGVSIDDEDVTIDGYEVDSSLLRTGVETVSETLRSDLFVPCARSPASPITRRSRSPIRGPRIDRASLLRYFVSFRLHAGFHEHCAEGSSSTLRSVARASR
jgi:7-cyano-7-deazaguanine reductase